MTTKNMESVTKNIKDFLCSEKKDQMERCYELIRDNNKERFFDRSLKTLNDADFDRYYPLVSVVIITANKFECDALNKLYTNLHGGDVKKRKNPVQLFKNSYMCSPNAYLIKTGFAYILHLNAYETGSNTPGGSTDLVRFVANNSCLFPSYIISFGICYGRNPDKQQIGDVIIPSKLYPWSIGQKITEKKFIIKNDNFNLWLEEKFSTDGIYAILHDYCNGEDGHYLSTTIDNAGMSVKLQMNIQFGNMSTGEAVVSSSKAKKEIREANRNEKEIGGEMEGYGIAKECIFYANTPCFIIKSICDWGEYKDIEIKLQHEKIDYPDNLKDKLQAYASFCAGVALHDIFVNNKQLLTLSFFKWTSNQKGKNRIRKYNYVDKSVFIKCIKKYFCVSDENAYVIFDLYQQNGYIAVSSDGEKYHIITNE